MVHQRNIKTDSAEPTADGTHAQINSDWLVKLYKKENTESSKNNLACNKVSRTHHKTI